MEEKILHDLINDIDQTIWPPAEPQTRRLKERWAEREKELNPPRAQEICPMSNTSTRLVNSEIFMTEPDKVINILRAYYKGVQGREIVTVMSFNQQMELIGLGPVAWGTVDHVVIHPAEVFTEVLKNFAKFFIVAHNHPSNNVNPSKDDLISLDVIRNIALTLDRPMKDYIIIANDSEAFYSHRDMVYDL